MRITLPVIALSLVSACEKAFEPQEPPAFPIFECDGNILIETTGVTYAANGHPISAQALTRNAPECM